MIRIQEEKSPISSGLYDLHELLIFFLIIISLFVTIDSIYSLSKE
jgi:hypothetical protein